MSVRLPVHGFVLAGGKSTRMGQDKALLQFHGRPMVEIAVEKLRSFCAAVSVVGKREDLFTYAPVVQGERENAGPAAGLEAGLRQSSERWAVFMPVDVPLLPVELLQSWVGQVVSREPGGVRLSYVRSGGRGQPAFCMIHRECVKEIETALEERVYKLERIFERVGQTGADRVWTPEAEEFARAPEEEIERWFCNVNTREELEEAERCGNAAGPRR